MNLLSPVTTEPTHKGKQSQPAAKGPAHLMAPLATDPQGPTSQALKDFRRALETFRGIPFQGSQLALSWGGGGQCNSTS